MKELRGIRMGFSLSDSLDTFDRKEENDKQENYKGARWDILIVGEK